MSAEIPTIEPVSAVCGDTWSWKKTLSDYPAPTWTLTYYLRSREGEQNFNATASGTDHLVSVTAAATAAYKAGRYGWTAVVTSGAERHTVGQGELVVLADPSKTGMGQDPRSHARKVLEALEAAIEGSATGGQMDLVSYTIGSRARQRDSAKLLPWLNRYKVIVAAEDAKNGSVSTSRLSVRL